MTLTARNLTWNASGRRIVDDISLEVQGGEFLGIVGPNGSGKTSLMALLAGLRAPASGEVLLDGQALASLSRRDVARTIALVEQQAETAEAITAREAVELGRTPHLSALRPFSDADDRIVEAALAKVEMRGLADRLWHTLSGGERQRVHIARALAQEPRILMLDEPTNHLDVHHQIALLDLVEAQDLTVVAALHDLNHAAMFCDRIAVLHAGRLEAIGTPAEILTAERLARIFAVEASVEIGPDGRPFIRYARPSRAALLREFRHAS